MAWSIRYEPVIEEVAGSEEEDWTNRSTDPDVVMATDYGTAAEVSDWTFPDATQSRVSRDTLRSITGGGSLRFDIRRTDGDASGSWRRWLDDAFIASGQVSQGMGAAPFWVQYRVLLPGTRRASVTNIPEGNGWKVAIISAFNASLRDFEIVHQNSNNFDFVQAYHNPGFEGFQVSGFGDIRMQSVRDRGPAFTDPFERYCLLGNEDDFRGCWSYPWDAWFTVLTRIRAQTLGGSAGNEFDLWVADPAGTEYIHLFSNSNFQLGTEPTNPNGHNAIWLLPFETNRINADHDTEMLIDQLIVSRSSVARTNPAAAIAVPLPKRGPDWFNDLADLTWATIAPSGIAAVAPNPIPAGTEGQEAVYADWCGGVYDSKRCELILPRQGGHAGYSGNEIYVLKLNVATPIWARVTDPRYATGADAVMDDGSPRSVHQYDSMCYVPTIDRVWMGAMIYMYPNAASRQRCWTFNRNDNTWLERATLPSGFGDGSGFYEGFDAYDYLTGLVWNVATEAFGSVMSYNPSTNVHTDHGGNNLINYGSENTGTICPELRVLVVIGSDRQKLGLSPFTPPNRPAFFNLNNPNGGGWASAASIVGTPPTPFNNSGGPGFRWHRRSRKILSWWGTGRDLRTLTPSEPYTYPGTWTWGTVSCSGATPQNAMQNGTYGRFQVVENFDATGRDLVVLSNRYDGATYVMKLPLNGV